MKIQTLPAVNGDFIIVSSGSGEETNYVVIDGGTPGNYKKNFGPRLNVIKDSNRVVDLLITTHIDDDHIGGVVNLFSDVKADKSFIKKVWFNSGEMLAAYFDSAPAPTRAVPLLKSDLTSLSVPQGVTLEKELKKLNIWNHPVLIAGHEESIGNLSLTLLSPNHDTLLLLNNKWQVEKSAKLTMSNVHDDFDKTVKDLAEYDYVEDGSIPNGSSIALLVKDKSHSALLLADAYPSVVVAVLKTMGFSNIQKIAVDFVKVSHHASKGNTSKELLEMIECKKFMISTDGSKHGLPDKLAIARIINQFPDCTLYFNYKNKVTTSIFLPEDFIDFPEFKCVFLEDSDYNIPL